MDGVLQYLYNNLFECKVCGARFSNKVHLADHVKTHPGVAEEETVVTESENTTPSLSNDDALRYECNENAQRNEDNICNTNDGPSTQKQVEGFPEQYYSMKSFDRSDDEFAIERVKLYLNAFREKQSQDGEDAEKLQIKQEFQIKQEYDLDYGNVPGSSRQLNQHLLQGPLYNERVLVKEKINGEYVEVQPTRSHNVSEANVPNASTGTEESERLIQHMSYPMFKPKQSTSSPKRRKIETPEKEQTDSYAGPSNSGAPADTNGAGEVGPDQSTTESEEDAIQFFNKIREQIYGKNIIVTQPKPVTKSSEVSSPDNPPKDKPYKCDRCGHAFTQKYKLDRHYRTHTGERPYKCNICGAAFSQKGVLVNHQRLHSGEKPYKCELCGASFSVKGYLIKHHRTHTGEKPFKCDSCDAVFGDRGNLSKHRKIHTGEKPYKCEVCCAAFSDRSTLMKHNRIHTDNKQYKCEFCHASFAMKSALTTHMKVHLDDIHHKCTICDAEFSARGYLIRHMRSHSGEKQYIPSSLQATNTANETLIESVSDDYSAVLEGMEQSAGLNESYTETAHYGNNSAVFPGNVNYDNSMMTLENDTSEVVEGNDGHTSNISTKDGASNENYTSLRDDIKVENRSNEGDSKERNDNVSNEHTNGNESDNIVIKTEMPSNEYLG